MNTHLAPLSRHLEQAGPFRVSRLPSHEACQDAYDVFRMMNGLNPGAPLLSLDDYIAKIDHASVRIWSFAGAHHETGGVWNTCVGASDSCPDTCVGDSNHGKRARTKKVRANRTNFLGADPLHGVGLLYHEYSATPVGSGARPNAFGDQRWERIIPELFELDRRFYDYSKLGVFARRMADLMGYRITHSYHEGRDERWVHKTMQTHNVAFVLRAAKHDVPDTFMGYPTIDGDADDFRYGDAFPGHAVILGAKNGALRGNHTGFVLEKENAS
jgi:hypothetical protein